MKQDIDSHFPILNLKEYLDAKVAEYNNPDFIPGDPISIPHQFSKKEDIEISGFLAATISWGTRTSIVKNANQLIKLMEMAPSDFLSNASNQEYGRFQSFIHRTFQADDCLFFLQALKRIYRDYGGMEAVFGQGLRQADSVEAAISHFRSVMLQMPHLPRSVKHIADPAKGSSAKRINMFLRWMVRKDNHGVDFGIWKELHPADLMCPLDVHSGRNARKLGLLSRKQDDWKAVVELTENLRKFDPADPVKYDFALFGSGVFEKHHYGNK
jgi:uncharacterized protein (TIGR02757 family)